MMELGTIHKKLSEMNQWLDHPAARNILASVEEAIAHETFHLAILGEFKRGKSSLVNSLLEEALLPTDVLPMTACIHILEYGEENTYQVVWEDRPPESFPINKEELGRFGAEGDIDESKVNFLRLRLNHPFLRQGITIIDTPGVNDISQSRAEITYNILPFCDAALFLLDAAAPLTRTEAEFLQTRVLSYSIDSLLFVVSKADRLDEDELEEALEGATERIKQVLQRDVTVIPYSAREVMRMKEAGKEHKDYTNLLAKINRLRDEASQNFSRRQHARLRAAADLLWEQLVFIESIHQLNQERLLEYQKELASKKDQVEAQFHQLKNSIDLVGRQTLEEMLAQSCTNLKNQITDQILYQLRLQEGNLEKFWSQVVPLQIERSIKHFSEAKAPEIKTYMSRFSEHVSREYDKYFRLQLALPQGNPVEMPVWTANVNQGQDRSVRLLLENVLPMSIGAIAGSLIFPGVGTIVGGALGNVLSSTARIKQQEQVKEELIQQVPLFINEVVSYYERELKQSVFAWFGNMTESLESFHRDHNSAFAKLIELSVDDPLLEMTELSAEKRAEIQQTLQTCIESLNEDSAEKIF
ncbi:dynamin family protein [Neobacillus sp. Marseille-QA0830]